MAKLDDLFDVPKKRTRLSLEAELPMQNLAIYTANCKPSLAYDCIPREYMVSESEYNTGRALAKSLFVDLQTQRDKFVAVNIENGKKCAHEGDIVVKSSSGHSSCGLTAITDANDQQYLVASYEEAHGGKGKAVQAGSKIKVRRLFNTIIGTIVLS